MGRPLERGPRNSRWPCGARPKRLADRRVDGTCSRSPERAPREAADRVPCAETEETGIFIEDFTTCRPLRANRRLGSPDLTEGARNTVGDQAWQGCARQGEIALSATRSTARSHRQSTLACGNENCGSLWDRKHLVDLRQISADRVEVRQTCRMPTAVGADPVRTDRCRRQGSHPVVGREVPGRDGAAA